MQRIICGIHTDSPTADKAEPADPATGAAVIGVVQGVLTVPLETASGSPPWVLVEIQTHARVMAAPHNFLSSSQEIQVCRDWEGRNMQMGY